MARIAGGLTRRSHASLMPLVVPRPISPEQARAYRSAGWWLDLTLTDLLRRQAAVRPAAPAVIAGDRTLTFADLDRESDR